jgi:hypothetical protein
MIPDRAQGVQAMYCIVQPEWFVAAVDSLVQPQVE